MNHNNPNLLFLEFIKTKSLKLKFEIDFIFNEI